MAVKCGAVSLLSATTGGLQYSDSTSRLLRAAGFVYVLFCCCCAGGSWIGLV